MPLASAARRPPLRSWDWVRSFPFRPRSSAGRKGNSVMGDHQAGGEPFGERGPFEWAGVAPAGSGAFSGTGVSLAPSAGPGSKGNDRSSIPRAERRPSRSGSDRHAAGQCIPRALSGNVPGPRRDGCPAEQAAAQRANTGHAPDPGISSVIHRIGGADSFRPKLRRQSIDLIPSDKAREACAITTLEARSGSLRRRNRGHAAARPPDDDRVRSAANPQHFPFLNCAKLCIPVHVLTARSTEPSFLAK
jgi:hypothetical protein